jgi:hypothetical protein
MNDECMAFESPLVVELPVWVAQRPPVVRPSHKQCARCKTLYPATPTHFAPSGHRSGLHSYCRPCQRAYYRLYNKWRKKRRIS